MLYCVIKNTTMVINSSSTHTIEDFLKEAKSAGLDAEQVEIITEEEYKERESLEPPPVVIPSDKERIEQIEQIINLILMGDI